MELASPVSSFPASKFERIENSLRVREKEDKTKKEKMSFFDKIKSAVMGNPVTREFELGRHVASAGPGLLWKVHSGVKKSSRQEVSVFVLDKKAPELEKLSKKQKEAIYEMLRKVRILALKNPLQDL